jgi:pimeloyl-ACP methyl ester carboxylesterase
MKGGRPRPEFDVTLQLEAATLPGTLTMPSNASGVVVFAHGSGSSRLSPRNRLVASRLNNARLGTLLFDLLTDGEARNRGNVFDIGLLAERLALATGWLERQAPPTRSLPMGYFGASTGAAAALVAAADRPDGIGAVVSRGGRPDLAAEHLSQVVSPTLLIVGGADDLVLELNRRALAQLRCEAELHVVPGAGHLFEEPGALDTVAEDAATWFTRYLQRTETQPAERGPGNA